MDPYDPETSSKTVGVPSTFCATMADRFYQEYKIPGPPVWTG